MLPRVRRVWVTLHLYLGLSAGVLLCLFGLTGSALVYYIEIDRLLNPELVVQVEEGATSRSLEELVQALQAAHPERPHSWRLEVPVAPDYAMVARYYKAEETAHLPFAPLITAINPYTLELLSNRFWGQYFTTWLLELHYSLLLGTQGSTVVAIIGIVCLMSLISGLVLWWPRLRTLKKSLALRWRHGNARHVYDLHVLPGVYGAVFLLLLTITGVVLARPDWVAPVLSGVSSLHASPPLRSTLVPGATRITADVAHAIAQREFPEGQLRWLETPDSPEGVYFVRLEQPGEPGRRFPITRVWIDQYSGEVLHSYNPLAASGADTFMAWQHPLHSGEAFGAVGRLLAFLSGLLPTLLLATGFLRWQQKRRARA
jgi:uncharacterized iron-regulated membrane protein